MFRKIIIHTRNSIKMLIIILISALIISGIIAYFYKISYSVTIGETSMGYTDNKSKLQAKINDYLEKGEQENVAYVQVNNLPEYKMCFLKRNISTNDDEIFDAIKKEGTTYFRYYAILENQEEKLYVANFTEAEQAINTLKEKKSTNIDNLTIAEKYEPELKEMVTADTIVEKLFVEPKPVITAKNNGSIKIGSVNTATTISSGAPNTGISFIRPVSGTISSRFGAKSSVRSSAHTGLDIATATGTSIAAAAGGTVTFAGYTGSSGTFLVISHGNGTQTYYGHCSKLYVSVGQSVSQGQSVAAVGSTGNSTGPHLHFEVRVNGVAYNPQNYI